MDKYVIYAMRGDEMCFMHVLLNALDLNERGDEVKIVFEGASVKLVPVFEQKKQPLYMKAKELGLVAGVCRACSASLGVLEEVQKTDLKILDDMKGHAGLRPFAEEGYAVITF